jgi:glycogen synthase
MRILFSSHVFAPGVGGIETVSVMLAGEFARRGHEVRLITQTSGHSDAIAGVTVYRRPSSWRVLKLLGWSEVFFHNNISLARAWPLLLVPRPWVVAHHVWIPHTGVAARLKRWSLRRATCIAVSRAIADDFATPSVVIPNPYNDRLFRELPALIRERDLVFVGRLVSDKGADLLVEALALLSSRALLPTLTVIGTGPEESALRAQVQGKGLGASIQFAGACRGEELVGQLNRHRILVVPSRWQEPFGLVALEGIACGCVVVGSSGGGLGEAMGSCGISFESGNAADLASRLELLLLEAPRIHQLRHAAESHLRQHLLATVAALYLRVLADV